MPSETCSSPVFFQTSGVINTEAVKYRKIKTPRKKTNRHLGKRRNDEITPCEKEKSAMRKDEISARKD